MTREPVDLIDELARRYNAGDVEGLLDLYADDAVIRSGGTFRGRDELRNHFHELRGMFGDARLDARDVHVAGNTIILECVHEGTVPGGGHVALPMALVFDVEAGRFREQRGYVESGAFAGILQAAAAGPGEARQQG